MVPSVYWLLELAKNREGRKILKAFKLPSDKEKLLFIAREMEDGNDELDICNLLVKDLPEDTFFGESAMGKDLLIHLLQKDINEQVDIRGDDMATGNDSVCNNDPDSPIISPQEEEPDLAATTNQSDRGNEKTLELESELIVASDEVSSQEIDEIGTTSRVTLCEEEIADLKPETLIKENDPSLETFKLIEDSSMEEGEGEILESQSESVVAESYPEETAMPTIVYLPKGGNGKAKKGKARKIAEQSNPDYNGYRLVPIGEVFWF